MVPHSGHLGYNVAQAKLEGGSRYIFSNIQQDDKASVLFWGIFHDDHTA